MQCCKCTSLTNSFPLSCTVSHELMHSQEGRPHRKLSLDESPRSKTRPQTKTPASHTSAMRATASSPLSQRGSMKRRNSMWARLNTISAMTCRGIHAHIQVTNCCCSHHDIFGRQHKVCHHQANATYAVSSKSHGEETVKRQHHTDK